VDKAFGKFKFHRARNQLRGMWMAECALHTARFRAAGVIPKSLESRGKKLRWPGSLS